MLGDNSFGQTSVPSSLSGATAVAAAANHTCVLANGAVTCYGNNGAGALNVPSLTNPISIAASGPIT